MGPTRAAALSLGAIITWLPGEKVLIGSEPREFVLEDREHRSHVQRAGVLEAFLFRDLFYLFFFL